MFVSPISFTAKIPVARCNIYDKSKDDYVDATLYEYDCCDMSDRKEIQNLEGDWTYKEVISEGMLMSIRKNLLDVPDYSRFFSLKSDDGDILGICYAQEVSKELHVKYISKRHDNENYKMIGQAMLASLADIVLNSNNRKLVIKTAVANAYDFYEKTCGFRPVADQLLSDLEMNRREIARFIRRTEEKTQGKIRVLG